MLEDFDLSDFWKDWERDRYMGAPVTDEMIAFVEESLRLKLPAAYLALLRTQNGGVPKPRIHPAVDAGGAGDRVVIHGIFGIDREKKCSLCGANGSRFYQKEWGYPKIGIYFADCPSGGHDMVALDYRACGPRGEPQVVHVDQEFDYKITFVAASFEAFLRGLRPSE